MLRAPAHDSRPAAVAIVGAALSAGIVHGAAFGAGHAAILQLLSAGVLGFILFMWKARCSAKQLLAVIVCFWLASYAVGLRWLWGGLIAPEALEFPLGSMVFAVAIVALACLQVLAMWAAAVLWAKSRSNAVYAAFVCASLLIADGLRDLLLPGFPWLSIGYTQLDSPFASLLPLIGIQGTGWMVAMTALLGGGLLATTLRRDLERRSMIIGMAGIALVLGSVRLAAVEFTRDDAPIKVALLQTAMTTREKFSAKFLDRQLVDIVEFARAQDARLVVTPETALPTSLDLLTPSQTRLLQSSVSESRAVILGSFSKDSNGNDYNSAVLMQTPPGRIGVKRTTYLKRHLAPLGEYAPAGLRWLANLLGMPVSNLIGSQDARASFYLPGLTIIPSVCGLDLAYGDDLRHDDPGPRMLVNLSNPIFFSSPVARDQYLAIARARALEQQLPVLIAANYAPTAIIEGNGAVSQLLPAGKPGVLTAAVHPRSGNTPYSRMGEAFADAIMLVFGCGAAVRLTPRMNLRTLCAQAYRGRPRPTA